jgi:cell fate regulator YaaT (PSP1 superfamily)
MKIGDVEYQGDKTKAIFYYIADDRVDFRTLIKVLAETFRIRIEMKQIGTRQEAGRIGGIGPCGRKLCCSFLRSRKSRSRPYGIRTLQTMV